MRKSAAWVRKMASSDEVPEPSKKRKGKFLFVTESAQKRRKKQRDIARGHSRISIGDAITRWNSLKTEKKFTTHNEVATFLLESYEHTLGTKERSVKEASLSLTHVSSTPIRHSLFKQIPEKHATTPISEIGKASSSEMSQESGPETKASKVAITRRKTVTKESSFVDPLELSIDISEESVEDIDPDDEDYEPTFDITLKPENDSDVEEVREGDVEFEGDAEDGEPTESEDDEDLGPGVTKILQPEDTGFLVNDSCCLVYMKCLLHLSKVKIDSVCKVKSCRLPVAVSTKSVGSAVYLTWQCDEKHTAFRWCSQPVLNRNVLSGDLLISTAILASGNNYGKTALFARHLKMNYVSESSFNRFQTFYIVPAVQQVWTQNQAEVLDEMAGKDLVVLGDGRMDSPGHCAQYCTYTGIENDSKKVVSIITMDKRETEKKSTNLEKASFVKMMEELKDKDANIVEVVTDAHLQIGAVMKKDFPLIKHSHDIWHAAKSLGKKIIAAGQDKRCKELQQWNKDIVNHFWYSCQVANTYEEFLDVWAGVLHHVVDEHEWVLSYSSRGQPRCSHGPLSEDDRTKKYLKKGSPAMKALREIVLNKRLLNNVHYYLNFRSTAHLESFQNKVLMYASKRFSYVPPVYRARCQLAALDHNENANRVPLLNKNGEVRKQKIFNKKSGRWRVTEKKVAKSYGHIDILVKKVLDIRLTDVRGMSRRVQMEATDPRLISPTIAPVLPGTTEEISSKQKSRFLTDL